MVVLVDDLDQRQVLPQVRCLPRCATVRTDVWAARRSGVSSFLSYLEFHWDELLSLGLEHVAVVAVAIAIEPDQPEARGRVTTATAQEIVDRRCVSCHAGVSAPNGIRLETREQLEARARDIARQVRTRAMPPGNTTGMTDRERELVIAWASRR